MPVALAARLLVLNIMTIAADIHGRKKLVGGVGAAVGGGMTRLAGHLLIDHVRIMRKDDIAGWCG